MGELKTHSNTRIDFAAVIPHRSIMDDPAILFRRARKLVAASQCWLGRAGRAREIAPMLSKADAAVVEAYAAECEAQAARLVEEHGLSIAA